VDAAAATKIADAITTAIHFAMVEECELSGRQSKEIRIGRRTTLQNRTQESFHDYGCS
jgi:hypothetical protein